MITATLTRPTSISPITSCERKVYLVEKIDIGSLAPPRARTIYLEPIPKRARKKKTAAVVEQVGSATPEPAAEPASDIDSTRAQDNSSSALAGEENSPDAAANPRSPIHSDIRSEISGDSAVSTSTSTGPSGSAERSHKRDSGSQITGGRKSSSGVGDRTITATIELLKGGCLPGDMVSVKISVQHIKRIKSMHGVIVTLYRQGRIDSSPPISLFKGHVSEEEARRLQKEEYYPKSKTGLGGLSLSSAGSCSVFRKDLSQTFTPLIIDPVTLTASVTTSVRIPEDAFPTIRGVPGEMISFKYQLEVIVDLGGKLASQIQSGQGSSSTGGLPPGPPLIIGNPYEGGGVASWGSGRPIDTDRLRREKGVISIAFEVVVGTDDSSRQRGKTVLRGTPSVYTAQQQQQYQDLPSPYEPPPPNTNEKGGQGGFDEGYDPESYAHAHDNYPPPPHATIRNPYSSYLPQHEPPPEPPAPFYVPPPEIPDEAALSEKERIRRAETRLLPSRPEAVAGPSTTMGSSYPDPEENIYDVEDGPQQQQAGPSSRPPPPQLHPPASDVPQQPTAPPPNEEEHAPSAPTLDDLAAAAAAGGGGRGRGGSDDKQELERRRLLAEASAPPEFLPEEYDGSPASGPSGSAGVVSTGFEPSAPALADEEHYGPVHAYQEQHHYGTQHGYQEPEGYGARHAYQRQPGEGAEGRGGAGAGEELPRYER